MYFTAEESGPRVECWRGQFSLRVTGSDVHVWLSTLPTQPTLDDIDGCCCSSWQICS